MTARGLFSLAAAIALAAVVAGCGKGPAPSAPKTEVDDTLSSLSTSCGQAVQATAFGDATATLAGLDRHALAEADALIRIYRQNPSATYLGETMSSILSTQASAARSCRLERTANRLSAAL